MQFEFSEEDLKAFGLQEDLARRGIDIEAFIDCYAIDDNRNAIPCADALYASPLSQRAFHVVHTSGVDEFLKIRVVQ